MTTAYDPTLFGALASVSFATAAAHNPAVNSSLLPMLKPIGTTTTTKEALSALDASGRMLSTSDATPTRDD